MKALLLYAFGKGKKYFGVCGLMAVFTGLPLIGHGQLEGFSEQYGMDFARPFHDEIPDQQFMREHDKLNHPAAESAQPVFQIQQNLEMFDFIDASSKLDENVYHFFQ